MDCNAPNKKAKPNEARGGEQAEDAGTGEAAPVTPSPVGSRSTPAPKATAQKTTKTTKTTTMATQEEQENTEKGQECDEDEEMCRFCFEGPEAGELISPCACKGGQAFVHLECLRRWQRMVLVGQPTHPAYYKDDLRHHVCNVCKSKFTCAPPQRHELMQSFTGPEIAALLDRGCMIASRNSFSEMLEKEMRENMLMNLLASNQHWIHAAMLITGVEEDDGVMPIEVDSAEFLDRLRELLREKDLTLCTGGRTYRLAAKKSLSGKETPAALQAGLEALEAPCELVLEATDGPSCSNDHVAAVNMSRPIAKDSEKCREALEAALHAVVPAHPCAADVSVEFFSGGPCDEDEIVSCLVFGGPRGYTVVQSLKAALRLAAERVEVKEKVPEAGGFAVGQTVRMRGLRNATELNDQLAVTTAFDESSSRWCVEMCGSGQGKRVRPENLVSVAGETGRVLVFFGDARWTRAQLLGEVAKGHWGLCRATLGDLIAPVSERRPGLEERLAFAPTDTEMTDEYIRQAQTQMEGLRNEAREASAHAQH